MNKSIQILSNLRKFYTQAEIAKHLGVSSKTVGRWEKGINEPAQLYLSTMKKMLFPDSTVNDVTPEFTFIDLFAGIGGMRIAFEGIGGKCVFTSEWDDYALKTYRSNFPTDHEVSGDIQTIKDKSVIPDHDVLLAGFPCQPFSIAGVSKKNSLGKKHGFEDETQGTLFFDIIQVLKAKRPSAFLLENVKNLRSHDKGKTIKVIINSLLDLGYDVGSSGMFSRVIDGKHFVPQHRERTFIVGFRDQTGFSWNDLYLPEIQSGPKLKSILHPEDGTEKEEPPYTTGKKAKVSEKYILSDNLWTYLQNYAEKHRAKGNGFGYGLVTPEDTARTLSARYYKDGSEILVSRGKGKNPRRLTPRECARLMGFDNSERTFSIPVSDTRAYRQFGNSVVVPVVSEVARIMRPHIISLKNHDQGPVQTYIDIPA